MTDCIPSIEKRYSCRNYAARPVEEEKLHSVLCAAQSAPSACNKQPWRYYVVQSEELLSRVRKDCFLPPVPNRFVNEAPVLIAVGFKKDLIVHGAIPFIKGVPYQYIDVGISTDHLMLQATSLGLATCWLGWFHMGAARKLLQVPSSVQLCGFITLGYPADEKPQTKPRLSLEKIATFL